MKGINTSLGKLKTGVTSSEFNKENSDYKEKIRKETIEKCIEFSEITCSAYSQVNKIRENKILINSEIENIKDLEQGNEENLLSYIKELILNDGNIEFLIPYFKISHDVGHQIEPEISAREHQNFGVLGEISDII